MISRIKKYEQPEDADDLLRETLRRTQLPNVTNADIAPAGSERSSAENLKQPDFWSVLSKQARVALDPSRPTDGPMLAFAESILEDIQSGDKIEYLVGVHVAVAHTSLMRLHAEFVDTDDPIKAESILRQIVIFQKMFNSAVLTKKKYSTGGTQVIRHVHVNEGGQAVVAGVIHTGRNENKKLSNKK